MKIDLVQPIQLLASADDGTSSRTIQGIAIPYGTEANASTGPVRVLAGALPTDGPAPKLLMNHDPNLPVGVVTERVDTGTEMLFSAKVSKTTAGDEALVLAMDGVYDGVSVGLNATAFHYDGNTLVVEAAEWRELSLVTFPAFEGARITQVAATEATETHQEDPVSDEPTEPSEEEPMSEIIESSQATAPIIIGGAVTRPRVTAAEYLSAVITGKPTPVLAADNLLTDIPGLLPEPLLGDVWDTQFAGRPLCDAIGTRALPAGEQFNRRYISQHTAVGTQVNELDTLASQTFEVSRKLFTRITKGGYINLSAQSADWSEPALVQAILNDMVRQYAIQTEAYVGHQIALAGAQATTALVDPTDGDEVIAALYDGAAEMRQNTGVLPTHLIVSTGVWAKFGQAKDSGGNRIFPYLAPSNAAGTAAGAASLTMNPLGLQLIISDAVDWTGNPGDDNAGLLYAPACEIYESRNNAVRVDNPSTASAQLGLWGYISADLMPAPATSYFLGLIA